MEHLVPSLTAILGVSLSFLKLLPVTVDWQSGPACSRHRGIKTNKTNKHHIYS